MRLVFVALCKKFNPSMNSRVRVRRLLTIDYHGRHFTPEFDRICAESDFIPRCMSTHFSHLLQPLNVGYYSVLKRAYGSFVSDLPHVRYDHINRFNFLADLHSREEEVMFVPLNTLIPDKGKEENKKHQGALNTCSWVMLKNIVEESVLLRRQQYSIPPRLPSSTYHATESFCCYLSSLQQASFMW